ncbi:uncharacterized protein LOC105697663 [Orussus abietinus]|uniref:uncharacterized protein LOC105697663 n=1 Tax=Orussus abietinus TaxID=222816 RepID=UPI0006260A10|nr:uncharacterized protein LOC105697663 [Orussus abietinus]
MNSNNRGSKSEKETWAQSVTTVTPQEHGTIRTITSDTVVSGSSELPLETDPANFSERIPIIASQPLIDPQELEDNYSADKECQTYLQGVPKVVLPDECVDEATQTVYIGRDCRTNISLLQPLRDVIASANDAEFPEIKKSEMVQTITTFKPWFGLDSTSDFNMEDAAIEILGIDITEEEHDDDRIVVRAEEEKESEIVTKDFLDFVVARTLWICEPKWTSQKMANARRKDEGTQTRIKYDYRIKRFIFDAEMQTDLSCGPKTSTSRLLDEYWEMRNSIKTIVDDCFMKGVYPRIVIDETVNGLLDQCAKHIHLPPKEGTAQTVASFGVGFNKEEQILNKLKLPLVVDPLESSVIVIPLLDAGLEEVCNFVKQDALIIANIILSNLVCKTVKIGAKLQDIRAVHSVSKPPIDDIFILRKKKIKESMQRRKMENASTQTNLAGVPEVGMLEKSKEMPCIICKTQSRCYACANEEEGVEQSVLGKGSLTTRNILLAYDPCYFDETHLKQKKIPFLEPGDSRSTDNVKGPFIKTLPIGLTKRSIKKEEIKEIEQKPFKISRKLPSQGSLNSWIHTVDTSLNTAWTTQDFKINERKASSTTLSVTSTSSTPTPSHLLPSTFDHKTAGRCQENANLLALKALHILKNACCTPHSCAVLNQKVGTKQVGYNQQPRQSKRSWRQAKNNQSKVVGKSKEDDFTVIPVRMISDSEL